MVDLAVPDEAVIGGRVSSRPAFRPAADAVVSDNPFAVLDGTGIVDARFGASVPLSFLSSLGLRDFEP